MDQGKTVYVVVHRQWIYRHGWGDPHVILTTMDKGWADEVRAERDAQPTDPSAESQIYSVWELQLSERPA